MVEKKTETKAAESAKREAEPAADVTLEDKVAALAERVDPAERLVDGEPGEVPPVGTGVAWDGMNEVVEARAAEEK